MKYKLSIVIPVFNNWNYTKNCLNNLIKLPKDIFEIIIVDNASTDCTALEIKSFSNQNINYIINETNLGFGAAVNKGIVNSCGDYVMILNNDIKFGNESFINWFQSLIDILENNTNHLIGPTGGFVDPNNKFSFVYETDDINKKINYMSGWCLTASKEVWNKLSLITGPFDSETFFLYFEDTDLSFRAVDQNINFLIIPTPLIHIGKQTSKLLNTSKHYLISKDKFLNKWSKFK